MKYIEIAEGSVKNRGIIIPADKLWERITKSRENNEELYNSVWEFEDKILDHFKSYKTISSFKGKASIPYIIFDIDKKEDTDEFVLRRAQEFVRRLEQDYDVRPEELRIFYSGRGYHVYMPNYFKFEESEVIRQEVKQTIVEYFPEVDSSIYNPTSIIRSPYSLNKKSNLYKVPLTVKEFFSLEAKDIMEIASSNDIRNVPPIESEERDFSQLIVKAIVERQAVNYRDEPTKVVTCMQHLYNKGGTPGTRHQEGMRLISTWRRMGVPKDAIFELMKKWSPTLEVYEMEKMVNNIFDKGYRYGCNDIVMSKYCDPKCIYYQHKNYTATVTEPDEIDNLLSEHSRTLPFKKYIDLDKIFRLPTPYRIYEGEMVIIWGDTKLGKSTLIQNIVAQSKNMKFLYLPLENGKFLDARRLVQIEYGFNKEQVMEYASAGVPLFKDKLSHIKMVDMSMNAQDLRKIITSSEVDAVVVDTADQILTPGIVDYTAKTENLAIEFRNICRDTKTTMFIVHHINKKSSEDDEGRRRPLTIHSGKGSSALEQKADKIISIEGDRDGSLRKIRSLGARDENPFSATLSFNKENFRMEIIME